MSSLSTLPASDASDSGTIGPEPAIFTAIWLPVQIFFVGLRYYSRSISRRSWALDDILVLISLAFQIAIAGLTFDSYVNGGLGHHFLYLLTVHPTTATHYLLNNFTISLLCIPASSIPRLAILHLYHRLFTSPRLRLQILILSLILLLAAAIYLTLICLMCIPIRANWDITMKESEYKCIDVVALQIWTSFPSLLIDGWMLALPLPTIWRLRGAGRRLKWGVGGALGVGSFGLITAIIRFAIFLTTNSPDRSRVAGSLLIWVQVESGCYLISACLPVCRPVLDRSIRFWRSRWRDGRLWGEWVVGRVRMAVPVRWRGDVSVIGGRGGGGLGGGLGGIEVVDGVKVEGVMVVGVEGEEEEGNVLDSRSTKVEGGTGGSRNGDGDLEAQGERSIPD